MFEQFIITYSQQNLGELTEYEPLAKHTTLRVGGPARIFVQPTDKDAFIHTINLIRKLELNFKILGKGSNLLPSDATFEGVVVKTDKALDYTVVEGTTVYLGAGVSDVKVARDMAKRGLSGMEFLSGVPGTIGGAVFMNAGAYLKEMKDILIKVQILDDIGELRWCTKDELALTYRSSIFQKKTDWIIVEAVIALEEADANNVLQLMRDRKEKRMLAQPLELPSAGSTFRNPDGHAAWKLVEDAGLRGFSIGGAMVSDKHTNFVVNCNEATAQHVADVIAHVKQVIQEQHDLEMHQEVEFFNWED